MSKDRGTALYLAIIIMTIMVAIAFGISTLFLGQIEMIREMGYSVVALYAADAGLEEVLMAWREGGGPESNCIGENPCLLNGAEYHLKIMSRGEGTCEALNYCIKSVGNYKGVRRAIEVHY